MSINFFGFLVSILSGVFLGQPLIAEDRPHAFSLDAAGRPLVTVNFDHPKLNFKFLIDTASSRSSISRSLTFLDNIEVELNWRMKHYSSFGGQNTGVVRIKEFDLFGRKNELFGLMPIVGEEEDILTEIPTGIIGQDFLQGNILKILPQKRDLRILANNSTLVRDGWKALRGFRTSTGALAIHATLNKRQVIILFATGSSSSLISYRSLQLLYPKEKFLSHNRFWYSGKRLLSASRRPKIALEEHWPLETRLKKVRLKIEGRNIGQLKPLITDFDDRDFGHTHEIPLVLIGSDDIMTRHLALDFRDYQLWYK